MKHLKQILQIRFNFKPYFLCVLCLFFLLSLSSNAQDCVLACNDPTPESPLQVTVDLSCNIRIVPDMILEAPQACPGDKQITVRALDNTLIADGVEEVEFVASTLINQVFSVTVTDIESGIFCVGFIEIVDNVAPTLTCEDRTISCVADTSVANLGEPILMDNCPNSLISLTYEDVFVDEGCISNNAAIVRRVWNAVDVGGNETACLQTIFLERPDLLSIDFPRDHLVSCDMPDTEPDNLGFPRFEGLPIENGGICDLSVTYSDDSTMLCGMSEFQILRTWTVIDLCTNFSISNVQVILIQDETAPEINCPSDLTVTTEAGQCYATVSLPEPIISDNCDGNPNFFVSTSYGAVGTGPHSFVPVGQHTVQYTAVDECGNTNICTITLTVVDDEAPVAVCDDRTAVSIPTGGIGIVKAITFDEGSTDNCADTLYFKVRKMEIGACNGLNGDDAAIDGYQEWFDDKVIFCCEEMDAEDLQVVLKVYEIDPGPGPVDPSRELPGGDLFGHVNECMVQVEVQDKLAPIFDHCPENLTIQCTDDYSDLSVFGSPVIRDNCGFTYDSTEQVTINDCGIGAIRRVFNAVDAIGNASSCTQIINVVNDNPFREEWITWPADYTSEVCGTSTDPSDLPEGFNEPQIINDACADVSYNYEDLFFDIAFPACYKILRTWTVLDWCVYNPDNPEAGGKFTSVQVIKVKDTERPVLTCPDNVNTSLINDCTSVQVDIDLATAEDCTSNLIITNNSPYASSGGANASGVYPRGTTLVTFSASDRCGNVSSCEMTITVEDLVSPTPLCLVGLSVSLSEVDGEEVATVGANSFDAGSTDNCTPIHLLKKTIRRGNENRMTPPNTTQITFNCGDIGTQLIEFWVTDEKGNSDFCATFISIQDNNNVCMEAITSGNIAGGITTEMGEMVEDVAVQIIQENSIESFTGPDGLFNFSDIPWGNNYTVIPEKNTNILAGISTIDLILISKHILGVQKLDTPYKIIAADIDKNDKISTIDLIKLRKLILGIATEMPNGNQSWRFVDANFIFPNPNNPFVGYFPEKYNVNNFSDPSMEVNFIGVKIGDVNNSAAPNSLFGAEYRAGYGEMVMRVANKRIATGATFTVKFNAAEMNKIVGYQFTLNFDPQQLEFIDVEAGGLPEMSEANFGLFASDQGLITTSWNEMGISAAPGDQWLFSLTFRAKTDMELKDVLSVSSKITAAEAYTAEGDLMNVSLAFEELPFEADPADPVVLYQNNPNPFRTETTIGFSLQEPSAIKLDIFDTGGKVYYDMRGAFDKGYHEVKISREDLPAKGILYYRLESGKSSKTKKMMIVD